MMPGYSNVKIRYVDNLGVTIDSTFEGLLEDLLGNWQSMFDVQFDYETRGGVANSINQLKTIESILFMKEKINKGDFPLTELVIFAQNRGYRIEGFEVK